MHGATIITMSYNRGDFTDESIKYYKVSVRQYKKSAKIKTHANTLNRHAYFYGASCMAYIWFRYKPQFKQAEAEDEALATELGQAKYLRMHASLLPKNYSYRAFNSVHY